MMRSLQKWLIHSAVCLIQKRSQPLKAKLLSFSNTSSSYQLQHNIKACFCWNNLTLIVRECCHRSCCGAVTGCSKTFGSKAVPAPSQLRLIFFKKKPFSPFLIGGSELWLSGLAALVLSILAVGAWLVGDAAAAPRHREAGRVLLSQLTEGW